MSELWLQEQFREIDPGSAADRRAEIYVRDNQRRSERPNRRGRRAALIGERRSSRGSRLRPLLLATVATAAVAAVVVFSISGHAPQGSGGGAPTVPAASLAGLAQAARAQEGPSDVAMVTTETVSPSGIFKESVWSNGEDRFSSLQPPGGSEASLTLTRFASGVECVATVGTEVKCDPLRRLTPLASIDAFIASGQSEPTAVEHGIERLVRQDASRGETMSPSAGGAIPVVSTPGVDLTKLPDRQYSAIEAEGFFARSVVVLGDPGASPELRASVFDLLEKSASVDVVPGQQDSEGREAVALEFDTPWPFDSPPPHELRSYRLLLDPTTSELLELETSERAPGQDTVSTVERVVYTERELVSAFPEAAQPLLDASEAGIP